MLSVSRLKPFINVILFGVGALLIGCTKDARKSAESDQSTPIEENLIAARVDPAKTIKIETHGTLKSSERKFAETEVKTTIDVKLYEKLLEVFQTLASVEGQTLKILDARIRFTQFQVIGFAFEVENQVKRPNPGFFCHRFKVQESKNSISIDSVCENPARNLFQVSLQGDQIRMTFFNRQWGPIIGDFSALTRPDRGCTGTLKNDGQVFRLVELSCANTVYQVPGPGSEEIRLDTFRYANVSGTSVKGQTVELVGGLYRDLARRKDIKLTVPVVGDIQIEERELKVKDEFEHLIKK